MTKNDFVSSVAEKAGLSKADAKKAIDAFCETVSDVL
jgi:DNA-binding protein HU-beta